MITIDRNIQIQSQTEKPVVADLFYKANQTAKPIVIFCHGYKGYKDWGAWDLMAKAFAKQNFLFIKFNFSHNGGTPKNPIDFPDLEAFANDNYSTQLDDLEAVINWIISNKNLKSEKNLNDINLIGHSRGGGIIIIKAAENKHINKIVSLAGVSDYASRFPKGEKLKHWKNDGVYYVENSRTHQQMPHYYQFYQDFQKHKKRLDIKNATQHLNKPHLIIHAKDDTSVLPNEAQKLHLWNPESELYYIENGGHTFGTKQPWKHNDIPIPLQMAMDKTIDFLKS